jgi:hypothetical protein
LVQHQEKITPLENPALSEIRIYLIFGTSETMEAFRKKKDGISS